MSMLIIVPMILVEWVLRFNALNCFYPSRRQILGQGAIFMKETSLGLLSSALCIVIRPRFSKRNVRNTTASALFRETATMLGLADERHDV